jgi:hypothetical protein
MISEKIWAPRDFNQLFADDERRASGKWNRDPKPFICKATADVILDKRTTL